MTGCGSGNFREVPRKSVDRIGSFVRSHGGQFSGMPRRKGGASELLSVNPGTLRYRMKKLGITSRKTFYQAKKSLEGVQRVMAFQ